MQSSERFFEPASVQDKKMDGSLDSYSSGELNVSDMIAVDNHSCNHSKNKVFRLATFSKNRF